VLTSSIQLLSGNALEAYLPRKADANPTSRACDVFRCYCIISWEVIPVLKFRTQPSHVAIFASLALIAFSAQPATAQQQSNTATVPVTTVVTVLGPKFSAPPALGKSDVVVRTGDHRENVLKWVSAQGERGELELAILIDDGTDLGPHLDELRRFIQAQPKAARVGVFYASMGMTLPVAPFCADHNAVAQKVRITFGPAGTSTSIYLSLIDVLKKLQPMPGRREVLLIGDGHDRLRGDLPVSPDLDTAIDSALKADIIVHTLYSRVGHIGRLSFDLTLAQDNLTRLASETGGQSFFQGLDTPVSFTPFLDQLDMVLHNQYFLTFATAATDKPKGELRSFKVTTEQNNVSITAPSRVFVPGTSR
jgi:hypothetical protein